MGVEGDGSGYSWPANGAAGEACREAWAATVAALPRGTRVSGEVIARQHFGVFPSIDSVPDALGLVEIGCGSNLGMVTARRAGASPTR